ncbi:TIGR01777 family oxidoreductase [Kistimonas scapharcae]|uniref:TIGR01777 family oxidoreductase n=1 Tax=Kistimonas scapharcae TaxID=1036133 RepID=A0ABP8UZD8_9GAMM
MSDSVAGKNGAEKTVLVTGATGFIGRFLVPELLADGWRVIVYARPPLDRVINILGPSVSVVLSLEELQDQPGIDACINLAGEGLFNKRWTTARKQVLMDSRIGVTRQLRECFERLDTRPGVLISGSAIGYYGMHGGDVNLAEQDTSGDDFAADLCRRWEKEARDMEALGMRVCLLRTGIVLHPGYGALSKMLPPFRFGLGGRMGDGHQVVSWIHIRDMVSIILFLLRDSSLSGAFNVTAPHAVTNDQLSQALASTLHRPCLLPMPGLALRMLLGESASLLLSGQRVIPTRVVEHGFSFAFPKLDDALKDLLAAR